MIYVKLTIMAFLWAGGFIAAKLIAHEAGPFTISFLRFLIATVIMAVLVYKKEQYVKIGTAMLVYALGGAVFGIFCYNYFFLAGIKLVDAGRGSVIISTVPIVIALVSRAFLKEKIGVGKLAGILISIFGAVVVITKGQIGVIAGPAFGRGEVYLMFCVLCASIFTLCSRQMLNHLTPMLTMVCVSALGTVFLAGPALWELTQVPVQWTSSAFIVNLLYLSIGPSVLAVIFYYQAIREVGPVRAS